MKIRTRVNKGGDVRETGCGGVDKGTMDGCSGTYGKALQVVAVSALRQFSCPRKTTPLFWTASTSGRGVVYE
jgi:hypothetical protein